MHFIDAISARCKRKTFTESVCESLVVQNHTVQQLQGKLMRVQIKHLNNKQAKFFTKMSIKTHISPIGNEHKLDKELMQKTTKMQI